MLVVRRQSGVREPVGSVYVGRPSPFGNPFLIGRDGSRAVVLAKYSRWIRREEQSALREKMRVELRSASALVCWCAPEPCHAELIRAIVREGE